MLVLGAAVWLLALDDFELFWGQGVNLQVAVRRGVVLDSDWLEEFQ